MISQQAIAGLRSLVLQSFERVAAIGAALATRFGLPTWQMTQTATDANRSCLRLARAISGHSDGLVFNGCYHGTVDETLVCLENGKMRSRAGSRGPPGDAAAHTRVIEFNDEQGLRQTLTSGKIAAVLCEPALTNMGMVLPLPGFHQTLRRLTREHGTLLIIDETAHAVRRTAVVAPDVMDLSPTCWSAARPLPAVCPARFTALLTRCAHASTPCRRMPNTLLLAVAALEACLAEVMTDAAFAHMETQAARLEQGLEAVLRRRATAANRPRPCRWHWHRLCICACSITVCC